MSYRQEDWERRIQAHMRAKAPSRDERAPRLQQYRAQGYSNQQIAHLTGIPVWDVNLIIGPNQLRGHS